ncbi:MAG: YqaJ viral recombinase family protein [Prevotella sp.]|nr:YqaJ viral recombinase family protein [Prevotella sp.]
MTDEEKDPEQRTLNWFRKRLGMFTGSMVATLMRRNRQGGFSDTALSYIYKVAAERALGARILYDNDFFQEYNDLKNFESKAMRYGTEQEPNARERYEEVTGFKVIETSSVRHDVIPYFASSPDGMVIEANGCIEIKCPEPPTFLKYRNEIKTQADLLKVKPEYYYQTQAHIMCTGADWCDFVVYNSFMKHTLSIWHLLPDVKAQTELETAIIAANALIDNMLYIDEINQFETFNKRFG